ncbi:MAG: phage tail protein [Phenylobacterium sp.]|uniref:phage tail protein n=1 Tax=Phenylobacterium sp. TaxID=1871053 RepID=UPI00391BBD45
MSCRLFPEAIGGLDELELLRRMRQSGGAASLMRGDGTALGWFVVTNVRELHTSLGPNGVGRMVDVEISLKRTYKPTPAEYFQPTVAGLWDYNASQVLKNTWGQEPG